MNKIAFWFFVLVCSIATAGNRVMITPSGGGGGGGVAAGGVAASDITMSDDIALEFGTAGPYWYEYDSTDNRLEFWSGDIDGAGTDAMVMYWPDGMAGFAVVGDVSVSDTLSTRNFYVYGLNETTDTATVNQYISGNNAYAKAAVNTSGGGIALDGGVGSTSITAVQATGVGSIVNIYMRCSGTDTTYMATAVAGAPGSADEYTCATNDDTCASALAVWINGKAPSYALTAEAVANKVYLSYGNCIKDVQVVTENGTGTAFVATQGNQGKVHVGPRTQIKWNDFTGTDVGLLGLSTGQIKVTDGSTGYGDLIVDETDIITNLNMLDDAALAMGTGDDYWFEYDSATTQLQLWSSDGDGSGTDTLIAYVVDGTNQIRLNESALVLAGASGYVVADDLAAGTDGGSAYGIIGQHAYHEALTGVGGNITLAPGSGAKHFTVVQATGAGSTVTITWLHNGTYYTKTLTAVAAAPAGVDEYVCETSDEVCSGALAAAIVGACTGLNASALTSGGNWYASVYPLLDGVSDINISSANGTGTLFTAANNPSGAIYIPQKTPIYLGAAPDAAAAYPYIYGSTTSGALGTGLRTGSGTTGLTPALTWNATDIRMSIPVEMQDDIAMALGAGSDYWVSYDSSDTRLEYWSSDCGAGVDCMYAYVEDGTDDLEFIDAVSADNFWATTDIGLDDDATLYFGAGSEYVMSYDATGNEFVFESGAGDLMTVADGGNDIVFAGDVTVSGTLNATVPLHLADDADLTFGNTSAAPDYWQTYNSASTQWEAWTSDSDGAGLDAAYMTVNDGTDDVTFSGDVSAANVIPTTAVQWASSTILNGSSTIGDGKMKMTNAAGTFGGIITADAANSFRFRNLADNDDADITAERFVLNNKSIYIEPSAANYGLLIGNGTNNGGQLQYNTSSNYWIMYRYDGATRAGLTVGTINSDSTIIGTTVTGSSGVNVASTPLTAPTTGTLKMVYSGNGWQLSGDQQYSLVVNSVKSGKITVGFESTPTTVTFAANPGDASKTCTGCRPAQRHILGISIKITTAGTNCASIDVGDGVDVDRYGAAISVADNTYVDIDDATADPSEFLTADGDVVITANGGNCYGLVAKVVANTINYQAQTVD